MLHHLMYSEKHYLDLPDAEDFVHVHPTCIQEEETAAPSSPKRQGPPPPSSSSAYLLSRTVSHRLMPYARMPASPPAPASRPNSKACADVAVAKARGKVVRAIGAPAASSSPAALREAVNALKRCEEAAKHASRLSALAAIQFTAEALTIKEARLVVEGEMMQLNG